MAREYTQNFSAASSGVTSATFVDWLTTTSDDGLASGNKVIVLVQIDKITNSADHSFPDIAEARVTVDDVEVARTSAWRKSSTITYGTPLFYVGVHSPTTEIALELRTDSGTVTGINGQIITIDIDDLVEGTDYHYTYDDSEATLSQNSVWASLLTDSFNTSAATDYLVLFCASLGCDAQYNAPQIVLDLNDSGSNLQAHCRTIPIGNNSTTGWQHTVGGAYVWTPGAATPTTFELKGRTENNNAQSDAAYNSRMLILDPSVIPFTKLSQSDTLATSSAWDTTYINHTYTPADTTNRLYIGSTGRYDSSAEKNIAQVMTKDATTVPSGFDSSTLVGSMSWTGDGVTAVHRYNSMFLDTSVVASSTTIDLDVYNVSAITSHDPLLVEIEVGDLSVGGVTTNLGLAALGDLSESDIATLASDAGVTLTSAEKVGKMNEIAGTSNLEYEGAKDAIKTLFGL